MHTETVTDQEARSTGWGGPRCRIGPVLHPVQSDVRVVVTGLTALVIPSGSCIPGLGPPMGRGRLYD